MKKILSTGVIAITAAGSILAHGGHTMVESNLFHYLLAPDHLLAATFVIVAGVALYIKRRQLKALLVKK